MHGHVQYITTYLNDRIDFFDDVWTKGKDICILYYDSNGPIVYQKRCAYVKPGDVFGKLPELSCDDYNFKGYYDSETGEKYNPSLPINESKYYVAKWEPKQIKSQEKSIGTLVKSIINKVNLDKPYYAVMCIFLLFVIFIVFATLSECGIIRRRKHGKK